MRIRGQREGTERSTDTENMEDQGAKRRDGKEYGYGEYGGSGGKEKGRKGVSEECKLAKLRLNI